MTSSRPYLIRALHEWILDNGMTPYLLVDVVRAGKDALVPEQFVENGKIVFNLSPSAVKNLHLGNDVVSFDARFRGVAQQVFVPVAAVLAVYAQENGKGMVFPEEEGNEPPPTPASPEGDKGARPSLRVVK